MENRIRKIADHYSYDAQSRQLIEEMAELTEAFNKFWRKNLHCGEVTLTPYLLEKLKKTEEYTNILEEVADVHIMILQITHLLQLDIMPMVEFKLDRQIERIEKNVES